MNEIRAWLLEHDYTVLSELITPDGNWVLELQANGVTIPVVLIAREVEQPQLGIAGIEALITVVTNTIGG